MNQVFLAVHHYYKEGVRPFPELAASFPEQLAGELSKARNFLS